MRWYSFSSNKSLLIVSKITALSQERHQLADSVGRAGDIFWCFIEGLLVMEHESFQLDVRKNCLD